MISKISGTPDLLAAIRAIYAAAIDDDRWPEFLRAIACAFHADGARFAIRRARYPDRAFTVLHGWHPTYDVSDSLSRPGHSEPVSAPETPGETHPYTKAGRAAATQWLTDRRGQEAHYHISDRVIIAGAAPGDDVSVTLCLFRATSSPAFDIGQVHCLGRLMTHALRAVQLREQATAIRRRTDAIREALDTLAMGVVVIDRHAAVARSNRMANSVWQKRDGITTRNGIVTLDKPEEAATLRELIASALAPGGMHGAMSVTRPSQRAPAHIVVGAVRPAANGTFVGRIQIPLATLLIAQPDDAIDAPASLLRSLFDLTPTEARVCEQLMRGRSPFEIGRSLNMALNTCRLHLKRCYAKVDVDGQTSLVAKVMQTPVWLQWRARDDVVPEAFDR